MLLESNKLKLNFKAPKIDLKHTNRTEFQSRKHK